MADWGCPHCGHARAGHDERGCPGCDCQWTFAPPRLHTPAPGGDSRADAREQIARALADCHLGGKPYRPRESGPPRTDYGEFADAALTVPAVAEALAAREALQRGVEAVRRRASCCAEGPFRDGLLAAAETLDGLP